jgi:hypothetical protein
MAMLFSALFPLFDTKEKSGGKRDSQNNSPVSGVSDDTDSVSDVVLTRLLPWALVPPQLSPDDYGIKILALPEEGTSIDQLIE